MLHKYIVLQQGVVMKRYMVIILLMLVTVMLFSQIPGWGVSTISEDIYQNPRDMVIDSAGNSYIIGDHEGPIVMIDTLLASGDYIAKLDSAGNWCWALQPIGLSSFSIKSIGIDSNDYLYVLGSISGTCIFGDISITGLGGVFSDHFLAKLDTGGNWMSAIILSSVFLWRRDPHGN